MLAPLTGPAIQVTEAELELLEALWRAGPLTPAGLFAEVRKRRDWRDTTIKTLLARLMRKQAVRTARDEGRLNYRAVIEREAYVAGEVDQLLRRLFDGDPAALRRLLDAQLASGSEQA